MRELLSTATAAIGLGAALVGGAGYTPGETAAALALGHLLVVLGLCFGFGESREPLGARPWLLLIAAAAAQMLPPLLPDAACIALCLALSTLTYNSLVCIPAPASADLSGATVIVTGSSAGIGLETAVELLKLGATVVFACRSEARAAAAIADATARAGVPRERAVFLALDLTEPRLVRDFVETFCERFQRCEALVCNAGAMSKARVVSAHGWEQNFSANHLGHYLLCRLMLPKVVQSRGRIVSVSSSVHNGLPFSRVSGTAVGDALRSDPMSQSGYEMFAAYAKSKLAQILMTRELQTRADGTYGLGAITCVALHPGNAFTQMTRDFPLLLRLPFAALQPFFRLCQPPVRQAAFGSLTAVCSPTPSALRGAYLERGAPVAPSAAARDRELAAEIWHMCEGFVKPWLKPLAGETPTRAALAVDAADADAADAAAAAAAATAAAPPPTPSPAEETPADDLLRDQKAAVRVQSFVRGTKAREQAKDFRELQELRLNPMHPEEQREVHEILAELYRSSEEEEEAENQKREALADAEAAATRLQALLDAPSRMRNKSLFGNTTKQVLLKLLERRSLQISDGRPGGLKVISLALARGASASFHRSRPSQAAWNLKMADGVSLEFHAASAEAQQAWVKTINECLLKLRVSLDVDTFSEAASTKKVL